MQNNLNRIIALGVFLIALVVYSITLSPTVAFWDVGEFCAAGYLLQVPHPPGSPLFLLLLRIASMLPLSPDLAVRMHSVSAFASALSVMFTYLSAVKIIANFRGKPELLSDKITVYGASVIGALGLAFSYSFWFNAVEAEVYGSGMLFVSAVLWLTLRWYERADLPKNEQYLFLIAYLLGLSIGVHLGAVLLLFGVLMLYYFKKVTIEGDYEKFGLRLGILAFVSQVFILFGSTEFMGWISVMLMIALFFYIANFITFQKFFPFLFLGLVIFFLIYSGIVQGFPQLFDGEFGGMRSPAFRILPFLIIIGSIIGLVYAERTKKKYLHLASLTFLLIVLGYTSYTLVIVRANAPNMPMNENDPSDFAGLVRYISREQYGQQPKFMPRRWSPEPQHQGIYTNYKTDTEFMWRYQIDHMFNRYLTWNFIGRGGDEQDSGISWKGTWGIPLLLGLFGMFYHIRKDWKMGITFFTLFLITGVILALYQNQQQPQPRERDYFYVSAFMIFALWISVAIVGIVDSLKTYLNKQSLSPAIASVTIAACTLFVPVNMIRMNFHQNSRAGNYVAWDYSYNILQSCEPNGILFTNGDNDTFPLWYLQDVEGVRRDVRIVNLSLVNTDWYIKQLKNNTPHGALKVPIEFSDEEITQLQPIRWDSREMTLPVTADALTRYNVEETLKLQGITDASSFPKEIKFTMTPTMESGDIKAIRIQDIMVHEILRANRWQRPVHFAVTCSPDSKIGLDDYLWYQGLTWELKPIKSNSEEEGLDIGILEKHLMTDAPPSKTQQFGYRFRNLNNPDVFFDENTKRMITNYRYAFLRLSIHYNQTKQENEKARAILNRMEQLLPRNVIPMDWRLMGDLRTFHQRVGNTEYANDYTRELEAKCWALINEGSDDLSGYYSPYRYLLDIYNETQQFDKALDVLGVMKRQRPGDKNIENQIKSFEARVAQKNVGKDSSNQ